MSENQKTALIMLLNTIMIILLVFYANERWG